MNFYNKEILMTDMVQRVTPKTVTIGKVPKKLAYELVGLFNDEVRTLDDLRAVASRERNTAKKRVLENPNFKSSGSAGYIGIGVLTVAVTLLTAGAIFLIVGKLLGY